MAIAQTVAEEIEMLLNPKPEEDKTSLKIAILRDLPQNISPPTLSNVGSKIVDVNGWCSFSKSYGNENYSPVEIAKALESVGWEILPASLVKYGNYRRGVHRGIPTELPKVYSRADLKDSEQILPLWIRPCQYTACDAYFYAKTQTGLLIKVSIDVPGLASIYANRIAEMGGWYFAPGSAKLHYNQKWTKMFGGINQYSRGYVDTPQGISGEIYWNYSENLKASEILSRLYEPKSRKEIANVGKN